MVSALAKCMIIALGLTMGWQFFGRDLAKLRGAEIDGTAIGVGAVASLPPSITCAPFSQTPYNWQTVFFGYNVLMILLATIGLNVRVRCLWEPMLVTYPTLLVYGALNFECKADTCQLPSNLVNFIGLFVGTNLASALQYFTATPAVSNLIPVLLILAPGSGAVLSVVQQLHNTAGDPVTQANFWNELALEGLSYALGMYVGFAIWAPVLRWRDQRRSRAAAATGKYDVKASLGVLSRRA